MISRIVKMTFQEDKIQDFLSLFERTKHQIRNFDGCESLTLLRDKDHPQVLFTYSHWQSETHLQRYRDSELFAETWKLTKAKFAEKAAAWTLETLSETSHNNSGIGELNQ